MTMENAMPQGLKNTFGDFNLRVTDRKIGDAAGFFRVAELDGTWWMIDPNGYAFYMVGTDHIDYNAHQCQVLGYSPHNRYCEETYGSEEAWAKMAAPRLRDWGYNTLPAGHSKYLRHTNFAHIEFLGMGRGFAREGKAITPAINWTGFPDVFSPEWPEWCDRVARRMCAPSTGDPWLIGYFLDNELQWHGEHLDWRNKYGMAKVAWMNPKGHAAKTAWIDTVRGHFPTVSAFNAAWNSQFASFDELEVSTEPYPPSSEAAKDACMDFVRQAAELYFSVCTEAIRRHDPNHLVLGPRFAGWSPGIWDIAGKYCDVISFNNYPIIDVDLGVPEDLIKTYRSLHEQSGRPLMMTEWCFLGTDTGLPGVSGGGMKVRNQTQRAQCFRSFQSTLFSLPFFVGSNYFMYVDEPVLGIKEYFPEDGNYGLVTYDEKPHEEFVATVAAVQKDVVELHEQGRLEYVYTPGPPSGWNRSLPPIIEKASSVVESGNLELNNETVHGCGWDIRLDGRLLGRFQPAVFHGLADVDRTQPKATEIGAVYEDDDFTVIDLCYIRRGDPGVESGVGISSYDLIWRFWLPKHAETPWIVTHPVSITNTGESALKVSGLSQNMEPFFDTVPGRENLLRSPVRNYYIHMNAWELPLHKLGLGILALSNKMEVDFFRRRGRCWSDCWEPIDVTIGPGETYTDGGAAAAVFGYWIESTTTWLDRAEAARKEISILGF